MTLSGQVAGRRQRNAAALEAFGAKCVVADTIGVYKLIRSGSGVTLFTVGYERRDGEDLMAVLKDAGVEHLADVRDRPFSRKPDFRLNALKALCDEAGIEYGAWSDLGSTEQQRERLHETGDIEGFHRVFRRYAEKSLGDPLERLAKVVKKKSVALLCYERAHEECHRSVVADLVANRINATITAIL